MAACVWLVAVLGRAWLLDAALCACEFDLAPREAALALAELFAALPLPEPFESFAAFAAPGPETPDVAADELELSPPPEPPVDDEVTPLGGGGITGVERMESSAT